VTENVVPAKVLLEPFTHEGLTLPNRVVFPAMLTNFGSPEGLVTQQSMGFYEARARGGVGLIIVEATAVSAQGRGSANMLLLDRDACVEGLSRLVNMVKQAGSRVFIQLTHAGREADPRYVGGVPMAPSPLAGETFGVQPRELTPDDIEQILSDFVAAARRAREAGFDAVEFCGDRDDLIQQFLSPVSNHRDDEYGGSLEGRWRFLHKLLSRAREALGPDYPLLVRLPSRSEVLGGLGMNELLELAKSLEGFHLWAVEVGQAGDFPLNMTRLVADDGRVARGSPAREVKRVLSCPVIDEGNVRDVTEAAEILRRGYADLVAMGRPLITDPDLVSKATTSGVEVRPCIYNNVCRGGGAMPVMRCPANPTVGREQIYQLARRAGAQRKVVVLGGGLAGLHIACLAARLGFLVTLHEPSSLLGGLLALRARIPAQSDNYRIVDYLSRTIVRLNIKLRLRSWPAPERIQAENPYAVFVARRGTLLKPDIVGLDNVRPVDPTELLSGEVQVGQKVCVVGGGLLAAEIAYFLAHRDKTVTLLHLPGTCEGWDRKLRDRNMRAFGEMEGETVENPTAIEINNYGEVSAIVDGRTRKILTDTIVLAHGYETADDRYRSLQGTLERFYPVGDAYESMVLTELVYRGTRAVLDLVAGELI